MTLPTRPALGLRRARPTLIPKKTILVAYDDPEVVKFLRYSASLIGGYPIEFREMTSPRAGINGLIVTAQRAAREERSKGSPVDEIWCVPTRKSAEESDADDGRPRNVFVAPAWPSVQFAILLHDPSFDENRPFSAPLTGIPDANYDLISTGHSLALKKARHIRAQVESGGSNGPGPRADIVEIVESMRGSAAAASKHPR